VLSTFLTETSVTFFFVALLGVKKPKEKLEEKSTVQGGDKIQLY